VDVTVLLVKGCLRGKTHLYDLRENNIDCLQYHIACYDWSLLLVYVYCTDLQLLHDLFLSTVQMLTNSFVPLKFISLGPRDRACHPLVKLLLKRSGTGFDEGA